MNELNAEPFSTFTNQSGSTSSIYSTALRTISTITRFTLIVEGTLDPYIDPKNGEINNKLDGLLLNLCRPE